MNISNSTVSRIYYLKKLSCDLLLLFKFIEGARELRDLDIVSIKFMVQGRICNGMFW